MYVQRECSFYYCSIKRNSRAAAPFPEIVPTGTGQLSAIGSWWTCSWLNIAGEKCHLESVESGWLLTPLFDIFYCLLIAWLADEGRRYRLLFLLISFRCICRLLSQLEKETSIFFITKGAVKLTMTPTTNSESESDLDIWRFSDFDLGCLEFFNSDSGSFKSVNSDSTDLIFHISILHVTRIVLLNITSTYARTHVSSKTSNNVSRPWDIPSRVVHNVRTIVTTSSSQRKHRRRGCSTRCIHISLSYLSDPRLSEVIYVEY